MGMHIDASCYAEVMEKYFRVNKELGLTEAVSKEEYFGFQDEDVAKVHFHKQGYGAGLFFRLRDSRVIDVAAESHDPDPIWYDATTH